MLILAKYLSKKNPAEKNETQIIGAWPVFFVLLLQRLFSKEDTDNSTVTE
jgi:hypothetical protein